MTMTDETYAEPTHNPEHCDAGWCLVTPIVQNDGRVSHWAGSHRLGVETAVLAEHLVEVGVGREAGAGANRGDGEPKVHFLVRPTGELASCIGAGPLEVHLEPSEARALAKLLNDGAEDAEYQAGGSTAEAYKAASDPTKRG